MARRRSPIQSERISRCYRTRAPVFRFAVSIEGLRSAFRRESNASALRKNRPPKPPGRPVAGGRPARNGSAEGQREAIPPRALISGEREAGEAYAQHRPGRRLGDRSELEAA